MQRAGLALPLPNYSVEAETNKDGHFELEVRDTKQGLVTLVAQKQGYTTCSLLRGKRSARSASMKDVATPAPHIGKMTFPGMANTGARGRPTASHYLSASSEGHLLY